MTAASDALTGIQTARPPRTRRPMRIAHSAAAMLLLLPASVQATEETTPPAQRSAMHLSIASLSMAGRSAKAAPAEPEQKQATWRHTFGAERRTVQSTARRPASFTADIIVMSDVTSMTQARQVFPAASYHIVLSRQILNQTGDAQASPGPGVTAVAIRRARDLRVTTMDHLTQLADAPAGSTLPLSAGTAVRVIANGAPVWIVSVDLAESCTSTAEGEQNSPQCSAATQQLDKLEAWAAERRGSGEAVIVAGSFHRRLDGQSLPQALAALKRFPEDNVPAGACAADAGRSDLIHVLAAPAAQPRADLSLRGELRVADETDPDAGCVMIVRLML